MKRNLSAIIALVLVVVMVFPTAIFVGAADPVAAPAEDVIRISVDGGINPDTGRLKGTESFAETGTITLALTGTADGSITLPEGYGDVTVQKTTDNGAAYLTWSGSSFTIEAAENFARPTHSDTFEFTATKTVKEEVTNEAGEKSEKETTYEAVFTLTVNVVPKKIIEMKVYGTSPAFTGTKELSGSEEYNATEDLTITKVDVLYNSSRNAWDRDIAASTSNMKLDVIHTESAKSRLDIKTMAVDLIGDDDYLQYTYTDAEGLKYTGTVDLHVTTSDVVSVEVFETAGDAIIDESEITASALYQRFVAIVTLKEHEAKLEYYGTEASRNPKFTIKFYEDSQNKAELKTAEINDYKVFKEAFFTVQYEDAIWKSSDKGLRVKDFFDMFEQVPEYVSINWDNATYTEYYEGYVIGTDDKDWKNVVVTVTYEDVEEPVVYDSIEEIAALNLVLSPIVAREKYVTIESILGYDMGIASNLPTGFTLLYREVMSMTINAGKQEYKEGDKLDLSGIKATLKYNYGDPVTKSITNDEFTCSPKNGTKLTADMDEVLVVYKDPNTGKEVSASFDITVSSASGTIKEVIVIADNGKNEYFIGEAFEKDGYRLLVTYNDNTRSRYIDLADCTGFTITDTAKYKNGAFQKAFTGSITITFKLPTSVDKSGETHEAVLENISVIKRPLLTSIVASSEKAQYLEGESPRVYEFTITAKYDDGNQRVFKVSDTETGAAKTSYTITENGVKYTVKLTPTMIDEDTDTIRVSYTEQVTVGTKTTTTKYDDVEIDVTIPDAVLTYYNATERLYQTEAFEDLYDALERAEEVAAGYTGTNTSRIPSIELRRDVTMTSDYPVERSLEIDLNGHTLTMIRGAIYVASKASMSVEVTFTNSSKTDGKLVYSSSDDDTVIIVQNDEYVIDRDTDEAGKYEVTITTPKNGKVTGPKEVTHGHDAQFTITPNEGYTISTIKVNNKNTAVPKDGKLIVENVQAKLTVTVTFAEKAWDNPFTDVSKSATYYKSIQFVYENGLFTGMSATKFEPSTTMTRAMFVTVLGRLAGIDADAAATRYGYNSEFTDVDSKDQSIKYAIPYIKWASDNGLIEGYGNGKFGPKDDITHAQMYVLMERYASYIEKLNTNASGTNIAVNDKKDIPDWAYDAVEYAAKNSYLITSSNRLTPNANAKRSELAMLLDKFCTNVLDY